MTDDEPTSLQRSMSLGVQLLGSGLGAAGGAMTGDPAVAALAAMAGTTLAEVGSDFVSRFLSERQEKRVGALFLSAGAAIVALQIEGRTIRDDDFWEGEHSNGSEFAEGVLLAAIDSYEEKKIRYYGHMVANVATSTTIDSIIANYALRAAERLSWLEMCLLALTMRAEDFPMGDEPWQIGGDWHSGIVKRAWVDLLDGSKLLYHPQVTGSKGQPSWDLRLSATDRTKEGRLVSELMELQTIPRADLEPIWKALLARPEENQALG